MWTPATRRKHSRAGLRYETDLTDAEWRLVAPLLPAPKRTGRPLSWPVREIVNAIFYVMRGVITWRLLPSDLPPKSTVYRWFAAWRDDGVFEALNHALLMIDRERSGRAASPSACIIDSQSVKTNEAGGASGYDAGKKIMGRKRHALVDTDGRGLVLFAHPASVQDRDGAGPLLAASRSPFPFIGKVFADAGYPGVGVITAPSIASSFDDAARFKRSSSAGAYLRLTPRRYESGETSRNGRISKQGNRMTRKHLYEAATTLLTRNLRFSTLKAWGLKLASVSGFKKARIAVARKIAVILHAMWKTNTPFRWSSEAT